MFFFNTSNPVAARVDWKPKYWRLGGRHLELSLTLWRHTVKCNIYSWIWLVIVDFHVHAFIDLLQNPRIIVWEPQAIDSSSITQSEALWVWSCHVRTSNSIQDGRTLVVNILVIHLRVQLQHCTYQRKTLLFALIKVSTFICKRIFQASVPL